MLIGEQVRVIRLYGAHLCFTAGIKLVPSGGRVGFSANSEWMHAGATYALGHHLGAVVLFFEDGDMADLDAVDLRTGGVVLCDLGVGSIWVGIELMQRPWGDCGRLDRPKVEDLGDSEFFELHFAWIPWMVRRMFSAAWMCLPWSVIPESSADL